MESSSIELALMRIRTIEQNFERLNNFSSRGSSTDFQQILKSAEGRGTNSDYASGCDDNIDGLISEYSAKNGLDENFVKAVIKQESGFQPNVTSKAGAMGLMQLMPGTAKGLGVENAYDPEQNIAGGTKYLKNLLSKYDGNKSMALAAYNAGPNAVAKYHGIPPYAETQNYVKNVLSMYQKYQTQGN